MTEGYNFLEGTQTDINRRLLRKIIALEQAHKKDVEKMNALEIRIAALEHPGP